ncbi:MAG: hypothetical protein JNK82_19445 [Myxococcaceae bacterium]|nr:hypothetical protein [Myxococcaceae bacterium]
MSGKPPDPKQKPKTGLKPAAAVTGPPKPKPASSPSSTLSDFDFDAEPTANKRIPSLDEIRRITGSIPTQRQTAPLVPVAKAPAPAPAPAPVPAPAKPASSGVLTQRPNVLQKSLHHSGFDEEERTETSAIMGHAKGLTLDEDEDESSQVSQVYDGIHPPPALAAIDTWKATIPPAQSMFGRRSKRSLLNVIAQFAAGHNPRYLPDAKGALRAHIFVWDVSRAMGCEIPHFLGGRELTIGQTVDWLKMDGHNRGWRKLLRDNALKEVEQGNLCIVVPKHPKQKLIAVLRPRYSDNVLRVAAAIPQKGNEIACREAFGTEDVETYVHD